MRKTSLKSGKSSAGKPASKPTERAAEPASDLARPFEKGVWSEAERIARHYKSVLEPADAGFLATAIEMPTVFERGPTADEAIQNLQTALTVAIATLLERGEVPVAPASADIRREQINIRVSRPERLMIESAARRSGYRGVSDFVRATALSRAKAS